MMNFTSSFKYLIAIVSVLTLHVASQDIQKPTPTLECVGNFTSPNVAYTSIHGDELFLMGFKGKEKDTVHHVPEVGKLLLGSSDIGKIEPQLITDRVTWPNEAVYAPQDAVKGHENLLVVAGGFLVPFKTNGGITLIDRNTGKEKKITSTWTKFYHHVEWIDVDGDGLLDIVTAGATLPLFGPGSKNGFTSLYWLKQPCSNPLCQKWKQTKIMDNGPDVFFSIEDIDGDGQLDLLAPQFFSKKLVLYRDLNWLNPSKGFKPQVLDDSIGAVFNAVTADLNGDGKKEIVATNHNGDAEGGGVFVYEPTNKFKKHVVASGMINVLPGKGDASPGAPVVVKPTTSTVLPSIVVSGDGSGKAYLLTPKDTSFNYEMSVFLDFTNFTIGAISAGDVDNDGNVEVFVPVYEKSQVYVFRFHA